ncbi:hypothetical protein [Chryseobacterium candidae]|uniref:Lipoprotein n=1 Tax=Chryseobacterium candidae TaxID=1978493 RepID=A0ABY2R7Z2_9FLAO|nr:hypothetical protein [Chryseobacterium candidae]THV60701.1 hypothetical protein EK417_08925 [Chryseobacterium candidae]
MRYKIVNLVFLIIVFSCKDVNKFSAGSYPYAEVFEIKLPKDKVIYKIDSLKTNTDLQVPPFEWAGRETLLQDKTLKNGYIVFYIFIKESNQIMYFYVREDVLDKTRIGLISIQNGLSLGNWQEINKDLSKEENEQSTKLFKEKIISKLGR